jgi:CitMHS family citrate-Mg2+:H+ or citrate-Ca2+:H+ symporter
MLNAMAKAAVDVAPPGAARHMPVVLGILSMPLTQLSQYTRKIVKD